MKTAFLFPGQGAQSVGMGHDVAARFPAAAGVYERANKVLGYDLRTICFEGPAERLNATTVSQPAIFVTSAALLEVLRSARGLRPDVTAGLSLGEYTALYEAGVFGFEDALMLVQRRGQAMQAAADATNGAMVGIIGLQESQVRQLCEEAAGGEILEAVNFNCPGQVVVSGDRGACERAEMLAERYGALKAVRLEVAGAFHTEMMADAAASLGEAMSQCAISEPGDIEVIANISAEYYGDSEKIADGLIKQLTYPILWQKCMEKLLADGVEKFYEIGPGRVLTGLMRRIQRKTKVVNVSNLEALNKLLAE